MKTSWDLTHLYKNKDVWQKDYEKLVSNIKDLKKKIKNIFLKEELFLEFIELKLESDILIEKLYCYPTRHLDIDFTLTEYKEMQSDALKLNSELEKINNIFENEIINHSEEIQKFLDDETLEHYKGYIGLIIRRKNHIASNKAVLEMYSDYTNKSQHIKDSYRALFSTNIKFDDVVIDGEKYELNRNTYNNLMNNEKQENRKKVFDTYTEAFKKSNDILANMYLEKLKLDIGIAKAENYDSLLQKKLFELELPNKILDNLIHTINDNLEVMHEYTELKKKISGIEDYHIYDTSTPICNIPSIEYNLKETIDIIKGSLSILGKDYISIIDKMFEEGWIDVYPKDNKRTMSFTCLSYIGVPYILINYNGSINSARTLAHEIGHGIHTYYSKQHNKFEYFNFSYFLTEIASKVNEILANEYMLEHCKNNEEKKYILTNIIGNIGNSLFNQVMLTEFEHDVIIKIEANKEIDAQYLNNLYFSLSKKYNGPVLNYDDNIKYGWSKISHFIMQDVYYLYQYSIGTAIAHSIAYRILNHEENIVQKYKDFLSLGNRVSIEEALKTIDIDLTNEAYITDTIKVLKNKIQSVKDLFHI